ncbi:hypothetical protein [Halostagnicola sp. A56]|uniref:hypothetical protein n=1 Tax=Halostagnicola sp. A56 TaxID=1495067 RepID=UPI000A813E94|nr:hypothetical protein [Halostagnicola sp. A56]
MTDWGDTAVVGGIDLGKPWIQTAVSVRQTASRWEPAARAGSVPTESTAFTNEGDHE